MVLLIGRRLCLALPLDTAEVDNLARNNDTQLCSSEVSNGLLQPMTNWIDVARER